MKLTFLLCIMGAYKPGLGIILGIPTGINLNLESKSHATNVTMAWAIPDAFYTSASYHANFRIQTSEEVAGDFKAYLGVGALLRVRSDVKFGVKVPLGLKFFFRDLPVDIFADISPGIHIIPETSAFIEGAIGVRYYFGNVVVVKE